MQGLAVAAAVAALSGQAAAELHHRRHAHPRLARKMAPEDETCGCTTEIHTWYGEPVLEGVTPVVAQHEPVATVAVVPVHTTAVHTVPVVPVAAEKPKGPPMPTPAVTTCPTPGTYTIPATTITLNETTTVCGADTTKVPAGTHTLGGVTTIVEHSTEIVCPYPAIVDEVNTILTTTYLCPTPGAYTIEPITTVCAEEEVVVVPAIETYAPGTYTRDEVVTTITVTSEVVYCPFTTYEMATTTATVTHAPEEVTGAAVPPPAEKEPEVETPVQEKPAETATKVQEEKPVETPKVEEEKPETSKPVSSGGGKLGDSSDHWAMTYTPYSNDGGCKSKSEVASDIATIASSGFSTVRVYSTDCSTLDFVGDACAASGIKMIVGIFMNGGGCTNSAGSPSEQIDAIASWGRWDLVEAVIVGNEAIFNGFCTASQIADYIGECKSKFSGYSGLYTTAETLNIWQKSDVQAALCPAIDVTGANIHPYFNAQVSPSSAGEFAASQLALCDAICPGKTAVNLECGWPSAGVANGAAVPGQSQQAEAISSIRKAVGGRTVFFSFQNDEWKGDGECQCEKSWGSGHLF